MKEREQWVLVPLVSVGPLRFGMDPDQVTSAMGMTAPAAAYRWDGTATTVSYPERGATAIFGQGSRLAAVAVEVLVGPQVLLRGIRLIGRAPSAVRADSDYLAAGDGARVCTNWSGDAEIPAWGVSMGAEQEYAYSLEADAHRKDTVLSSALFTSPELADAPYQSAPVARWRDIRDEETKPGAWVKAAHERPHWTWTPLQAVGPLRFGMDPGEVADALGEAPAARHGRFPRHRWQGVGEWMLRHDRFDAADVSAHYACGFGHPPTLGVVTVHGRTGPQVDFAGLPLIGQSISTIDAALIQCAENDELALRYGCDGDLESAGHNMWVRTARTGDTAISEARSCQEDWEEHG